MSTTNRSQWRRLLVVLGLVGLLRCGPPPEPSTVGSTPPVSVRSWPDGWSEATHGPDAEPDYATVFDQEVVQRIDIAIEPEDWGAMLEQMARWFGPYGSGVEQPSPDARLSCEDRSEGRRCSLRVDDQTLRGRCRSVQDGGDRALACHTRGADLDLLEVPCRVVMHDRTWWSVGIRVFGWNSVLAVPWGNAHDKLPLKLDFGAFEGQRSEEAQQQTFHGLPEVFLFDNARDFSYLREKVGADLFREGGVPTPRGAFVRLYLDVGDGPTYYGLYTMVEAPARPFFEDQMGAPGGELYYTPSWQDPSEGSATRQSSRVSLFNGETGDPGGLEEAIAALHASRRDPAGWKGDLEAAFDVDGFLRWLAINSVLSNWLSYGNQNRNYFVYADPGRDAQLRWFPWDHNRILRWSGQGDAPLSIGLSKVTDDWPLIRYLLDEPDCQQAYWSNVRAFVVGPFARQEVKARLRAEQERIAPFVVGPDGETDEHTTLRNPREFAHELDKLLYFVDILHDRVEDAWPSDTDLEPPGNAPHGGLPPGDHGVSSPARSQ